MSQIETETERLLLEAIGKIPSARVLFLVSAGFSGVFSSSLWLGLDAPDRWTGTQDREYRELHEKRHSEFAAFLAPVLVRSRVVEGELRECSIRLGFLQEDSTDGISRIRILEKQTHNHVGK